MKMIALLMITLLMCDIEKIISKIIDEYDVFINDRVINAR